MSDQTKESKARRTREFSRRRAEARLERTANDARTRHEMRRISKLRESAGGLKRKEAELRRLERIQTRDPLRRIQGYDARKVRRVENFEIKQNPKGFIRKHINEGLDHSTELRVKRALEKKRRRKEVDS